MGLECTSDVPEYKWAEFSAGGGAYIGMGEVSEESSLEAGSNAVICITVEDVVAAKAELEAQRVPVIGEIQEVPGKVKMILVQDPSGNFYNIVQKLS